MKDCIFCFIAFLGAIYCLPVQQSILPHSRDYYAGYIKAITDNFEQLFAGDRQVRSTGEDDDSKIGYFKELEEKNILAQRRNFAPESLSDIKHFIGREADALSEIDSNTNEESWNKNAERRNQVIKAEIKAANGGGESKKSTEVSGVENITANKEPKAVAATEIKDNDETEKKNGEVKELENKPDDVKVNENANKMETEANNATKEENSKTSESNANFIEEDQGENKETEDSLVKTDAPSIESTTNVENGEGGEEEDLTENTSVAANKPQQVENEEENTFQQQSLDGRSNTPGPSTDDEMRREFILEHSDMNTPIFPGPIRGYRNSMSVNDMAYMNNMGGFGPYSMFPSRFMGAPYPSGFAYAYPVPLQYMAERNNHQIGETRSDIQKEDADEYTGTTRETEGDPPTDKPDSADDKKKEDKCDHDRHHLHTILVLPTDCHHHGHHGHHVHDGCYDHGCDHHDCGCVHDTEDISLHDIHHYPLGGHSEHYAHDSPCLTLPHNDVDVGYGYVSGGCGHHGSHVHHPVVLHPTHQEVHHIHPVHVDHVHHGGHHGHHHGHDIAILPHYGHTCEGAGGWNPYWDH